MLRAEKRFFLKLYHIFQLLSNFGARPKKLERSIGRDLHVSAAVASPAVSAALAAAAVASPHRASSCARSLGENDGRRRR